MQKWRILALDHGRNNGLVWESQDYSFLDTALGWAAWLQQRDQLFGYDNAFTVVEVTP
jgi:hypothetical protein